METQTTEEPIKQSDSDTDKKEAQSTLVKNKKNPLLLYCTSVLMLIMIVGAFLYSEGFIIAAKVNGKSITRASIIEKLEARNGAAALDSMISDLLLKQAASDAGITITEEEIATELSIINAQVAEQGEILEEVLTEQGFTKETLTEQIKMQKLLEKLLGSDIVVTKEDIDEFISANGLLSEGSEETLRTQIKEQLRNQKLSTAAQSYLTRLRAEANIKYFVDYE